MVELWDLYDADRKPLIKQHVRGIPLPEGTYHLVSDVWTINRDGKVLITQRHPDKPNGLLWECTGGSAITGEDSLTAALRELSEEVGVYANEEELTLIHSIRYKDRFVDTYITTQDVQLQDLKLQVEEVVGARLVTYEKLVELWEKGIVVPRERLDLYHKVIKKHIDKMG